MKKEDLAAILNGRIYRNEITREEQVSAKENGLVVVFGYSDDNMEFSGAIDDEVGAWDGTVAKIYKHPKTGLWDILREDDEEQAEEWGVDTREIEAVWCPDELDPASWLIKSEIPHATFDIFEDEELYCRGIVFSISDLK